MFGQVVVTGGITAEVHWLEEEGGDQVPFAVKLSAEAGIWALGETLVFEWRL